MEKLNLVSLPLQLFAAEDTGVTAPAAGVQISNAAPTGLQGVTAPNAGVQGVNTPADTARLPKTEDPDADFEQLIRGQFKEQYQARVSRIVQDRLKNQQKTLEQYRQLTPSLERLAQKYGVEATDLQALGDAIAADTSLTSPQADAVKARMTEQDRQYQARQQYGQWAFQAQQARQMFPTLELSREVQNPRFLELLQGGARVDEAYLVVHRDEIIPAAMRFSAAAVEEKLANRIAANGARPMESGMSAQGTAVVKQDVSRMSKAQRQDIIRRVRQGEIIRF